MGKLRLIKQTRDTMAEVTAHLERLIAEVPPERGYTAFHPVSVFGGDQEIGAVIAAAQEGLGFQLEWRGRQIGEKPVCLRASLQIPGRNRPVRHAILISPQLAEGRMQKLGLPVLPKWAE